MILLLLLSLWSFSPSLRAATHDDGPAQATTQGARPDLPAVADNCVGNPPPVLRSEHFGTGTFATATYQQVLRLEPAGGFSYSNNEGEDISARIDGKTLTFHQGTRFRLTDQALQNDPAQNELAITALEAELKALKARNPGNPTVACAEARLAAVRAQLPKNPGHPTPGALQAMRPKKVVFVVAMEGEAQPLIQAMQLKETPNAFPASEPMRAFEGRVGNIKVALVINGKSYRAPHLDLVGPAAAAVTTHAALERFHPDLLISAGTAGGFANAGAQVGDVYLSEQIVYHDRHIPLGPDWETYALGNHPHPSVEETAAALGTKKGVVATGSSFVNTTSTDLAVIKKVNAAVVEMEAAAVAEKCAQRGVKMIAMKAITDIVEKPDVAQFERNFKMANTELAKKVHQLLAYLQRPEAK